MSRDFGQTEVCLSGANRPARGAVGLSTVPWGSLVGSFGSHSRLPEPIPATPGATTAPTPGRIGGRAAPLEPWCPSQAAAQLSSLVSLSPFSVLQPEREFLNEGSRPLCA